MKKIALTSLIMAMTVFFAAALQAQDVERDCPRENFRQTANENCPNATTGASDNANWQENDRPKPPERFYKQMPPSPRNFEIAGRDRSERFRDSYRDIMRKRNDEFIDWLRDNFPVEAERFDIAAEANPEESFRDLMPLMMKYREIFVTEKKNPELAELMKKDMQLHERRNEILTALQNTDNEQERQKLETEIKDIVAARFDLILEKRKMRFEELQRRLEELSKEIERQKIELSELDSRRDEQIQSRIEELLSADKKMKWD